MPGLVSASSFMQAVLGYQHQLCMLLQDPSFDRLITALYGNVEKYDTEVSRVMGRLRVSVLDDWNCLGKQQLYVVTSLGCCNQFLATQAGVICHDPL